MSKTYNLTLTNKYYGQSSSLSNTFSGYTSGGSTYGCTGSGGKYGCVSMFFDPDVMAHLTSRPSNAITAISLKMTVTNHSWGGAYGIGPKTNTNTASFLVSSLQTMTISSDTTSVTSNLLNIGIPASGAYVLGQVSTKYEQPKLTTAILTVTTRENDYTITYNSNGGSGAPGTQSFTVLEGDLVNLSSVVPSYQGYEFLGWSTNSTAQVASYQPGQKITINTNLTLYAVWRILKDPRDVTLSYDLGDGSGSINSQTISNTQDYELSFVISSVEPTHATLAFIGWLAPDGATYMPGDTIIIQESVTLVAQYAASGIKVTLDPNGGVCSSSAKYVSCKEAYGTLPVPTRAGYKFGGWGKWICGGIVKETDIVEFTVDHTLHARWLPPYRVIIVQEDE